MNAIDQMKSHFAEQDVQTVEVPEWGTEDKPMLIYFKPFTLAEQKKLFKLAKNEDMDMMAYVLILKAMDKKGDKMFGIGDKRDLMNSVDPHVLSRVAGEISKTPTVDEFLGN
jgi:hypothetical protein